MTDVQKKRFESILLEKGVDEFHHGCCIGADEQANDIAILNKIWTIGHPPTDETYMSKCSVNERRESKSYLVRDRDIVDETFILIGNPKGFQEELRSGTWATIRYARKNTKYIIIIFPDGSEKIENEILLF